MSPSAVERAAAASRSSADAQPLRRRITYRSMTIPFRPPSAARSVMRSTVCAGAGGHMRRTTVFSVAGCRTGTATAGAARPARRARSPARRACRSPSRARTERPPSRPARSPPRLTVTRPGAAAGPPTRSARPPRVSLPLTRTPGTTTRRSSRSRPWRCPKRPPRSPVPCEGKSNAAESARARSSSVAPTALTVRARRAPRTPSAGVSWPKADGGTPVAGTPVGCAGSDRRPAGRRARAVPGATRSR